LILIVLKNYVGVYHLKHEKKQVCVSFEDEYLSMLSEARVITADEMNQQVKNSSKSRRSGSNDLCSCSVDAKEQVVRDLKQGSKYVRVTEYEYGHRPRVKKGW